LKIKGNIQSASTAGGYAYRIIVGYSTAQKNVTASSLGLVNTDIFLAGTGTNFIGGAIINPKAFTVLHDSVVDINSPVAATADIAQIDIKVPLSGKFDYIGENGVYGKVRNLYIVVIGAVIGGTTGTTACGSYFLNSDLVFQDQ